MKIYADGGTRNNGKPNALGGWAWLALMDEILLNFDNGSSDKLITNNQNEIYSITHALSMVKSLESDIEVYMDSAYVINCINDKWYVNWRKNGWKNAKKKPVENKELWEALLFEIERLESKCGIKVIFKKVKGHSGDVWNEMADRLANDAMDEAQSKLSTN